VSLLVTFNPEFPQVIENLASTGPFVFPDPSYVLTKGVKATMTIQVNGGIVTRTVNIKAKVPDDPWVLGGRCILRTDDRDHLYVRPLYVFDPDGNITEANWKFFNASNVLLAEVPNTPKLGKRIAKYPDGVVVSFEIAFAGFAPFFDSFNYFTVQLTDFKGTKSNIGVCDIDNEKQPSGATAMRGVPWTSVGDATPAESIDLDLGPRQ
jgi:hypothetical protein